MRVARSLCSALRVNAWQPCNIPTVNQLRHTREVREEGQRRRTHPCLTMEVCACPNPMPTAAVLTIGGGGCGRPGQGWGRVGGGWGGGWGQGPVPPTRFNNTGVQGKSPNRHVAAARKCRPVKRQGKGTRMPPGNKVGITGQLLPEWVKVGNVVGQVSRQRHVVRKARGISGGGAARRVSGLQQPPATRV